MFSNWCQARAAILPSVLIALCAGLSGCVTTGTSPSTSPLGEDPLPAFARGETRLTCVLSCAWADGLVRQKYRFFLQQGNWRALALEVINVGHEKDRNYYYLGRAAEGLGYKDAAVPSMFVMVSRFLLRLCLG